MTTPDLEADDSPYLLHASYLGKSVWTDDQLSALKLPRHLQPQRTNYLVPSNKESEIALYSYGWLDASIPHLRTFRNVLEASRFKNVASELLQGLYDFKSALRREHSVDELRAASPLFSRFTPDLRRDNYRFFFNPAITIGDLLVLTVFLEAELKELLRRPTCFANANKNLHHSFISEHGFIRKVPAAFARDQYIANTTEHSAYAKFYLTLWGSEPKALSLLIHPIQKSRLTYIPSQDPTYSSFKQDVRNHAIHLKKSIPHLRTAECHLTQEVLQLLSAAFSQIELAVFHTNFAAVLNEQGAIIEKLLPQLPDLPEFQIHHEHQIPHHKRRNSNLRRECWAMLRRAHQICHMYEKYRSEEEAQYDSADKISGSEREYLLLAVSDILKSKLEAATGMKVYRFMLSSEQIDKLTLKNERGGVRENIKIVPKVLERDLPVIPTSYPAEIVEQGGRVTGKIKHVTIGTICLDGIPPESPHSSQAP